MGLIISIREALMMKCPKCDKEMKKGQATFMSMEGFGTMMVSFVSDDDSKKSFLKRQSRKIICLSIKLTEKSNRIFCKTEIENG